MPVLLILFVELLNPDDITSGHAPGVVGLLKLRSVPVLIAMPVRLKLVPVYVVPLMVSIRAVVCDGEGVRLILYVPAGTVAAKVPL